MERKKYASGTEWEPVIGYSRAVRVGNRILVSGSTSTDEEGEVQADGDPYEQAVLALKNIERAVEELGGSLEDVVRTRIYVLHMIDWEEIGRAHGEYFGDVRPATSMVEVRRLIDPRMLVEIEAEAVVDED